MSTSFDIPTAEKYAQKAKEPRLLWKIKSPTEVKAIDTRNLSSKKWEEELLFDRGQEIQIKKVEYDRKEKIWKLSATIL